MIEKDFSFHVPVQFEDLEKASKDFPARVPITGIAATQDIDDVGEQILVKGCDITWLNNRGLINYDHKKEPSAFLGQVEKAWKEPDDFNPNSIMIKGFLWGKDKYVQDILTKAEAMRAAESDRSWGLSIEGKIFARDNHKIVKSMAHSVAMSLMPINSKAVVLKMGDDMRKSLAAGWCKSVDDSCNIAGCCDGVHSCENSCGDSCHCNVEKALTAGHGVSPSTQTGGGALRPEHLEGEEDTYLCPTCKGRVGKKDSHGHLPNEGLHIDQPQLVQMVRKSMTKQEAFDYIKNLKPGWSDELAKRFVEMSIVRGRAV